MKRIQTIILLAVLALTAATPLRAQYFDWVRTYQSSVGSGGIPPDDDNIILDMDADSQGNVYFLGRCVRGAAINGEELLGMVNHSARPHNHVSLVIVKMSPQGEMVWHKAVSCWEESIAVGQMQVVGDSELVCYVMAVSPELPNKPTCWFDSIIQYPNCILPMDSVYIHSNAFVTFDLDGNLKEQHFLNLGFLDTLGVPVLGNNVEHRVAVKTMGGIVLYIDLDGNIIIGTGCSNDFSTRKYRCDTCENPWQTVEYSVENGGVGAVRIMVDGRRSFFFNPENRPIKTNARLMKFSPHFDSLLEVRYLMQSRLDSPRTGLDVPGIKNSKILHITGDPEGNIYVVGGIDVSNTDTIVPIDSIQGLYIHVGGGGHNGFIIKYDPHLRPIYAKQLDLEGRTNMHYYYCQLDGDDLFVLCCGNGPNRPSNDFHYDGEVLSDLDWGVFFLRLSKEDGRLLSHGTAKSFWEDGTWQSNGPNYEPTQLTAYNNRVATRTKYWGNIAFAGDTIRAYRGQAAVIWDYDGHELALIDLHAPHEDNKGTGALFTDSSLYLCGMFKGEATFGDTSFNVPRSNGYLARYVDTSFLHPYVHHEPVAVTQPVAPAEPFFSLTPNPTDGRVAVEVNSEKLKDKSGEATITVCDATGREVMTRKASAPTTLLDLSGLAAGIYLVTLTTSAGTGTQRLVVR